MQVTEKTNEGLSRGYSVVVPATDLNAALDARIAEVTPTLNLKGFRPGKVPSAHVRRIYGKALMGEVVEKTINETSQQVLSDHHLRIATQPDLKPVSDMGEVIAGREDLSYDLDVEVMPEFDPIDVSTLALTRLVYQPVKAELDEALAELVAQNRTFEARAGKAAKAQDGDQVVIDFIGRVDGEAFEGGTASDAELVLGSDQFIPGFEAGLVGAAAGDHRTIDVTFPDGYAVDHLKGRAAVFEVTVKDVRAPKAAKADNTLAERLGMTDLAALKDALKTNLEKEYQGAARFKLKRALLDALDVAHDIALPPRMVEAEFAGIWREVEKDRAEGEGSADDEGKSEDTLKAEYRLIAERRVRLGLVLAEIGRRANVAVTEAELGDAMRAEAMRYGPQAQEVFDMLRKNEQVQTQMRAPIYEEKVVDLILGQAKVTDKAVSKEELLKEDEPPVSLAAPRKAPRAKGKAAKGAKAPAAEGKIAKAGKAPDAAPEAAPVPQTKAKPKTKTVKTAEAPVEPPSAPAPKSKTAKPQTAKPTTAKAAKTNPAPVVKAPAKPDKLKVKPSKG